MPQVGDASKPEASAGKKLLNLLKGKGEQAAAMEPAAALVHPSGCLASPCTLQDEPDSRAHAPCMRLAAAGAANSMLEDPLRRAPCTCEQNKAMHGPCWAIWLAGSKVSCMFVFHYVPITSNSC